MKLTAWYKSLNSRNRAPKTDGQWWTELTCRESICFIIWNMVKTIVLPDLFTNGLRLIDMSRKSELQARVYCLSRDYFRDGTPIFRGCSCGTFFQLKYYAFDYTMIHLEWLFHGTTTWLWTRKKRKCIIDIFLLFHLPLFPNFDQPTKNHDGASDHSSASFDDKNNSHEYMF